VERKILTDIADPAEFAHLTANTAHGAFVQQAPNRRRREVARKFLTNRRKSKRGSEYDLGIWHRQANLIPIPYAIDLNARLRVQGSDRPAQRAGSGLSLPVTYLGYFLMHCHG
jgi:hypothetical protein